MSVFSLQDLRKTVLTSSLEKVYTLQEIARTSFDFPVCAVLGDPIAHSLSPRLHHQALAYLGQNHPEFLEWKYVKILVKTEELQLALSLLHGRKFRGLNLTLPHKVEALKFVQDLTPTAKQMGSINTLILETNGYKGDNTDAEGFRWALKHVFGAMDFSKTPVFLYGAGGCARAITQALIHEGVQDLTIINRSPDRLSNFKEIFNERFPIGVKLISQNALTAYPKGLYINGTSLGLNQEDPLPFPVTALPQGSLVFDSVYAKDGTQLMQIARNQGLKATDGKFMLAGQASAAFAHWTGHWVPPEIFLPGTLAT